MKKTLLYWLIALVVLQALSGITGGIGLIIDPTGGTLGIPQSWLQDSLFINYLIPGIILFLVLGIYPLILAIGLLKRKRWSLYATRLLGILLVIWILTEIAIIGYRTKPPLQLIYGIIGIIVIILAYLKGIKNILVEK